jgi:hypothetical protein
VLIVWRDRTSAEMVAPIEEFANTGGANSSKYILNSGASSHRTPDRNCFEYFSPVRGNVILLEMTKIEYTDVGSVRLLCHLPRGDISLVLICSILFVPNFRKSLYSCITVKSIWKVVLINDGVSQVVHKLDKSVIILTFQSGNEFIHDPVQSESGSLADDTDYECWHTLLGHLFNTNVIQNVYEDGYLILEYQSTFIRNPCALSQSKHKVLKLLESNSTEVFELLYTDVSSPFPNESYTGSNNVYLE